MSDLTIVISGEIENSNFDEWKKDLLEKIRSVKKELTSDSDFAEASKHVKQFKAAEKSLKAAKKSALEQAADISKLFDAIDEVSEEARQARLSLDKQIKKRKLEIKAGFVEEGVDTVNAFIAEQSEAFQSISHASYNDEEIFEDALNRKASTKGMQKAITKTCERIKQSITEKAAEVDANEKTLANLPAHHQVLFQDTTQLLALPSEQLNKTIDERVALFDEKSGSNADVAEAEKEEAVEENAGKPEKSEASDDAEVSDYTVTVEITASEEEADAIREEVVKAVDSNAAVKNIVLSAV